MKFGVSLLGVAQQPKSQDMSERIGDVLTWVHACRDAGFDHITTGEHVLLDPLHQLQPAPLLARLIPESGDMDLVTTLIAPLHNPVDLAETWASIDVMSGGRVALCFALGYRDIEYAAYGVDRRHRVRDMKDVVNTLLALWRQEPVTAQGRGFRVDGEGTTLAPAQRPHPPVWIAANVDAAVVRAARWGLPWNISGAPRIPEIERQTALYRSEAAGDGHTFPMSRELYCATTTEKAYRVAGPFLHRRYAVRDTWKQEDAFASSRPEDLPELARDRFVIGDPDACEAEIRRYQELGIDRIHFRMMWPGMPLDVALEGLELFASEVIPRFR